MKTEKPSKPIVQASPRSIAEAPVPEPLRKARAPRQPNTALYAGITTKTCDALAPRPPLQPGGPVRDHRLRVAQNLDLYCDVEWHKRWLFDYISPVTGKRRARGLGRYPDVGLAQARRAGDDLRALLRDGRDPLEERAKNIAAAREALQGDADAKGRREATLRKLLRAYHATVVNKFKGQKLAKHGKQWLRDTERNLPDTMLDSAMTEIKKAALFDVVSAIIARVGETGWRVLDRLERVWAHAKFRELVDTNLPELIKPELRELYPKVEAKPHKALAFDRIPEFVARLRAFDRADGATKLALELCILTASRTSEIRGMRWNEIDTQAAAWNVPAERMKRPKPHYVALPPRALAILTEARKLRPGAKQDDLVFPSRDPRKPMSEMAMLMLLRRLKTGVTLENGEDETYSDVTTVHGFRAGFSSWASEKTNFREAAIEAALAHREQDRVSAAYKHLAEYRKDRAALAAAWAAFVTSGASNRKIINMRSKRSA